MFMLINPLDISVIRLEIHHNYTTIINTWDILSFHKGSCECDQVLHCNLQ
jgi:hypothetical protein